MECTKYHTTEHCAPKITLSSIPCLL